MDTDNLLHFVAKRSGADDARLVLASVIGEIRHRTVRIEVTEKIKPGPYRYAVRVRDEETREFLATGNPANTVDEALDNVHWQEVRPEE